MPLRPATVADIEAMHAIRLPVTENRLQDISRVKTEKYREMLRDRGRGWVFENDDRIVIGFGIADAPSRSFGALCVRTASGAASGALCMT